jgi:uncharacterized damage-inducible protein DinB
MDVNELLLDLFDRLPSLVRSAVHELTPEQLRWVPAEGVNSIGWLIWHLTRVQDDHVAELMGEEQLWVSGPWPARIGIDPDAHDTGYGHTSDEVATIRPDSPEVLIEYFDTVAARTRSFIESLTRDDLDRVVDRQWDPPVTLGVRLISIANDDAQHVGQAAFLRGWQEATQR